jgi:predicted O-methyltransferase YrrM
MSQDTEHGRWSEVDAYVERLFSLNDPVLEGVLETSRAAGLPEINVTPAQGRLLQVLARSYNARRVLEIGTLGGYSAICLGRALPLDGRVVTLELKPSHAEVARANISRAGLSNVVSVVVGPALDTMRGLDGPFDFIFIDADKEGYPEYLLAALRLARAGTVIVADNVVRDGAIVETSSRDVRVVAVQRFLQVVAAEPRLLATVVQTVGSKGYDGFAVAVVTTAGD